MRDSILQALRQQGRVSGEQLGKKFNVSRTAVWKHVNELRKIGYEIDSSPRTGYFFIKSPDLVIPEEIAIGLDTSIMGKFFLYQEEVPSTQDMAEEAARGGAEEGTVVISERQTEGRGRKGRIWASPPREGVYISVILRPGLRPTQVIQIPLIAGVAVCRAIRKVTPLQPRIKWPNDITLGGKKVGGILTEMSGDIDRVNHIVLGIGLNVNTKCSLLPEPTRGIATSLAERCGEHISRVRLVQFLLAEFDALYREFLVSGFDAPREEWKALDNTIGSWVKVSDAKEEIKGKALDIDEEGFLIVRKENGDVKRVISGDVSLIGRDYRPISE
jgi:BirA family biotin operon repressor/biotin-[acetyl-CoA-carboxylase] ligase